MAAISRGAASVPRRARTFHRPVDRDQSESLSPAAAAGRPIRPVAGCRRNRPPRRRRRAAYGAPSAAQIVPAPGTQILLPLVAGLARRGRAAILTPTYAEHARAARLAGHSVVETRESPRLAMPISPSSPIPTIRTAGSSSEDALLALAAKLRARGGVLVVDEAFMDVGPPALASPAMSAAAISWCCVRSASSSGLPEYGSVLRCRDRPSAARLAAMLGPWAVSGPALAIGAAALADTPWIEATRHRLVAASARLDGILIGAGLGIPGGTALFRLVRTPSARALFHHLGRAGILVRNFADNPTWLRFGLPAGEEEWQRLQIAMDAFRNNG